MWGGGPGGGGGGGGETTCFGSDDEFASNGSRSSTSIAEARKRRYQADHCLHRGHHTARRCAGLPLSTTTATRRAREASLLRRRALAQVSPRRAEDAGPLRSSATGGRRPSSTGRSEVSRLSWNRRATPARSGRAGCPPTSRARDSAARKGRRIRTRSITTSAPGSGRLGDSASPRSWCSLRSVAPHVRSGTTVPRRRSTSTTTLTLRPAPTTSTARFPPSPTVHGPSAVGTAQFLRSARGSPRSHRRLRSRSRVRRSTRCRQRLSTASRVDAGRNAGAEPFNLPCADYPAGLSRVRRRCAVPVDGPIPAPAAQVPTGPFAALAASPTPGLRSSIAPFA